MRSPFDAFDCVLGLLRRAGVSPAIWDTGAVNRGRDYEKLGDMSTGFYRKNE